MRVPPGLVVGNLFLKYLDGEKATKSNTRISLDELQTLITELAFVLNNDERQKQHQRYVEVCTRDILDVVVNYPDYVFVEKSPDDTITGFIVWANHVAALRENMNSFIRKSSPRWLTEKIDTVCAMSA
jgi:hypothetical protein